MENKNQKIISKLKRLVYCVEHAKVGYEAAAEKEADPITAEEFSILAQKRHELSVQMQQQILKLGGGAQKINPARTYVLSTVDDNSNDPQLHDKKAIIEYMELMHNEDTPYGIRTMALVQLESMNNLILASH